MKTIATRGRSYGERFCRSVLVTRRVGWVEDEDHRDARSLLRGRLVGACLSREGWAGCKMKTIATQGRSYGDVFVGACLSREGWAGCKMKTIATRGRSYGEDLVERACHAKGGLGGR